MSYCLLYFRGLELNCKQNSNLYYNRYLCNFMVMYYEKTRIYFYFTVSVYLCIL